jgi:membrane-bound serine protease (ClpP class)
LKRHILLVTGLVFLSFIVVGMLAQSEEKGPVFYIEVDGIINPATAKFITNSIDEATQLGGQCLIIHLDTPGGLMDSMRNIVKKELASTIPIIVYVAPSGARAASAGVFITMAANIAVMAPSTHIGAAHPVTLGAQGKEDKTMTEKIVNDTVSYIKTIAKTRGRNVDWAEKAVTKSVSITEEEAVKLNVVNFISPDLTDLLAKIDGKVVNLESLDRLYPSDVGDLRDFLRTLHTRSDPPRRRGWNLPDSGLLCSADASRQFCRTGPHSFCYHPLHRGG